jgi:selenocysteine lyase/cysteine desulfurase
MAQTFDVTALRKHFPALDKKQVYFDNAGGSQVIQEVIDSVSEYLGGTNVQLGASYPIAQKSTNLFAEGKDAVAKYINADFDEVGKSKIQNHNTTQMLLERN